MGIIRIISTALNKRRLGQSEDLMGRSRKAMDGYIERAGTLAVTGTGFTETSVLSGKPS